MKKLIVLMLACTIFFGASAQIEQGTVLLGGSTNLTYSSVSSSGGGPSTSITQVNVKAGYYIAENFVFGLNFGHQAVSGSSLTTIGGFGRYYPGGKFFLGAGYSSTSSSSSFGSGVSQGQFAAEAGYAAFIGKNIAIEPAVTYGSGTGYSIFGFTLGIGVYLNRPE